MNRAVLRVAVRRLVPVLVLGAVVAGVLIGTRRGVPTVGPILAAVVLALTALVAARGGRGGVAVVLALGAVGAIGVGAGARSIAGLDRSPLVAPAVARSSGELRGAVVGDPIASPWRVAVVVRAEVWIGERAPPRAAGARSVLVVARAADASRVRSLVAGDRVAVRGRLGPLDGYDVRYRWRHVAARLDDGASSTSRPGPHRCSVSRTLSALRSSGAGPDSPHGNAGCSPRSCSATSGRSRRRRSIRSGRPA